ncbi:MAG TPA: phage replisome organizer N-terminal domain-containing protein [Bacillota bacterium]|nr:phage replisome organizer N-terminal domain-containing protein [Bacillota bacterium]
MAGTPWFKFYDEFLDDPKMLSLSDGMVTLWVRMLCLANRSDERGVIRPYPLPGLARALYTTEEQLSEALELFASPQFNMIEIRNDEAIVLTNWQKRNPRKPSDEPHRVAERKRRWRESQQQQAERDENAPGTRSERVPHNTERDENAEERPIDIRVQSTPLLSPRDQMLFDTFWAAYPSRRNPKAARDAWRKLSQDPDFDPELVIKAAKNYAAANKGEMPKFIQQAHNFLKEETWRDYIEAPATTKQSGSAEPSEPVGPYIPGVEETRRYMAEVRAKAQMYKEQGVASDG